jgi:hypothetical protein
VRAEFYNEAATNNTRRLTQRRLCNLCLCVAFYKYWLTLLCAFYHASQLAMAFPAFSMVTSHHQVENYFGEHLSPNYYPTAPAGDQPGDAEPVQVPLGSVNYMQLFHAFPADLCADALSVEVTTALQSIQDAKNAVTTVTEENLLDGSQLNILEDGANLAGPHEGEGQGEGEEKVREDELGDPESPVASRDGLLQAALTNYAFAAPWATKFYAYTLLSEDQLTVMNDQASDRNEAAESSAYIYRYELHVSDARIDYSTLGAQSSAFKPPPPPPAPPLSPTLSLSGTSPGKDRSFRDKDRDRDGLSDTASRMGEYRRAAAAAREASTAALQAAAPAPDAAEKGMNAFCVSPVNLAVHSDSARRTPIQASIEVILLSPVWC